MAGSSKINRRNYLKYAGAATPYTWGDYKVLNERQAIPEFTRTVVTTVGAIGVGSALLALKKYKLIMKIKSKRCVFNKNDKDKSMYCWRRWKDGENSN